MKYPIGPRLRRVRREKDLTQQQLAEKAGLNMLTISRIEHGSAKQIYAETLGDLAQALDVSADYLLGFEERLTE